MSTIRACPGTLKIPPRLKHLVQQITSDTSPKNIPRSVWASHQRNDERLGPIYQYLSSTAKSPTTTQVSGALRSRAQSFQLVNGLLHYRSIREIGTYNLNEGWVLAVPTSLVQKIIQECHGNGVHGHGGETRTALPLSPYAQGRLPVHPAVYKV